MSDVGFYIDSLRGLAQLKEATWQRHVDVPLCISPHLTFNNILKKTK
jgi:hypothetical protein